MNELKSTTAADASDSIVISFASKWDEPIRTGKISVFFRKRAPRNFQPKFVYVYVGAPESALIGRYPIKTMEKLNIDDAVKHVDAGKISEKELREYAAAYADLNVFQTGKFQEFANHLTWSHLSTEFGFSPPQSFFVLSQEGQATVDSAGKIK